MRPRFLSMVLAFTVAAVGCASIARRPADLTQLGVDEAARLIRSKTITSAELTQAYIARADASRDLNVYITLDRAGAMAAAQRLDTELAEATFKCIGAPIEFKVGSWSGQLPALANGQTDLMWDTLYYTPERAQQMDFVIYLRAATGGLVAKGNPKHIPATSQEI